MAMMLYPFMDGASSLARAGNSVMAVALAGTMVITLLGSWGALWVVNKWRSRRSGIQAHPEQAHASLFVPPLTAHSPSQQETHEPRQMETAGWLQAGGQSPIGDIR
jgi:hypothetical protein